MHEWAQVFGDISLSIYSEIKLVNIVKHIQCKSGGIFNTLNA